MCQRRIIICTSVLKLVLIRSLRQNNNYAGLWLSAELYQVVPLCSQASPSSMHLPDPKIGEMARLEQVIKGSKCEYAKLKPGTREQLPITPELLLLKMRKIWEKESNSFDNIML